MAQQHLAFHEHKKYKQIGKQMLSLEIWLLFQPTYLFYMFARAKVLPHFCPAQLDETVFQDLTMSYS
jgi:hypothetical protein